MHIEKSQSSNTKIKPPINSNVTSRTKSKRKSFDVWKQLKHILIRKGVKGQGVYIAINLIHMVVPCMGLKI